MNSNYDDIINLKYIKSNKHKHMPLIDRAAQFSPFAALTGHKEAILETARYTDSKLDLDDSIKEDIGLKLSVLKRNLSSAPQIRITFFEADKIKNGGFYNTITGTVKKINEYDQLIIVDDKIIKFDDIYDIFYKI